MNDSPPKAGLDLNTFVWVNEKRLPGFGKLLESWLNVHRSFCAGIPSEDHPWAYTERPQVGLLSNAAVLIGGIAFEEWGTEKRSDQGNNSYGRNDLWLRLCPPSDGKDYYIEAKQAWLDVRLPASDFDQTVIQIMNAAQRDAERLSPKNGKVVAVSFFTLKFEDESTEVLNSKMRELLLHIEGQSRGRDYLDAIAVVWQKADDFKIVRMKRKQVAKDWENNDFGMILIAKCVQ